eukprot:scaffold773_cov114-Isochrysis_galbana.AAC.11
MEKGADATHRPRRRTPAEVQRSPLLDEMVLRLGQRPIHLCHLNEILVRGLGRKEGHFGPVVLGNRRCAEAVGGRQTAVAVERTGHRVYHDAALLARRRQHARHRCELHMEVGGHQLVCQLDYGHGSRPIDGDAHRVVGANRMVEVVDCHRRDSRTSHQHLCALCSGEAGAGLGQLDLCGEAVELGCVLREARRRQRDRLSSPQRGGRRLRVLVEPQP